MDRYESQILAHCVGKEIQEFCEFGTEMRGV